MKPRTYTKREPRAARGRSLFRRPTPSSARYITLQDGMASSGIPYTTLRDMGLKGLLDLYRFGGRLYLDRGQFERFLVNGRA